MKQVVELRNLISSSGADENDLNNFDKFLSLRGAGVYLLVFESLLEFLDRDKINYKEFSNVIRYDKNLRDILYKYLATFEEDLREQVYSQLEYSGKNIIHKVTKNNIKKFYRTNEHGFNFYKYANLDLGSLITLIKHYKLNIKCIDNHLEIHLRNINNLRNKVMHHNFLLINATKPLNKLSIESNLKLIEKKIMSLYALLPKDWRMGFLKEINNANYYNLKNGEMTINSKYIKLDFLVG